MNCQKYWKPEMMFNVMGQSTRSPVTMKSKKIFLVGLGSCALGPLHPAMPCGYPEPQHTQITRHGLCNYENE